MADAVADEEAPKKKLPIVRIIITFLGAIVLIAVGAGATFLYMKLTKPAEENPLAIVIERKAAPADSHGDDHGAGDKGGDKAAAGGHGAPAAPASPQGKPVPSKETFVTSYFEFPGNFTTNLKGSRRFVQMSIGLATQYDKRVIENVQKHEVAIRSEVLVILADQAEPDVVGVENRRRLQGLIKDAINRLLTERTNFGGIDDVFITALVMQ